MIRRLFARFLCRILAPELDELITAAVNVKVEGAITVKLDRKIIARIIEERKSNCVTDTRRHEHSR